MQFDKTFVDLYDTTTDDLIGTLVQQSRYKDYLMGRNIGHGPNNDELYVCKQ
jgi:hypothetical protein